MPILDERQKRIYLASEAKYIGRGGLTKISKLTGVSRVTINSGILDLETVIKDGTQKLPSKRMRQEDGGRKKKTDLDETIKKTVLGIVNPHTMGSPMNPLVWTSKSLRKIAVLAKEKGYNISHKLVGIILNEEGFSLQGYRKTDERGTHMDRDAQFEFVNAKVTSLLNEGNHLISVDCNL